MAAINENTHRIDAGGDSDQSPKSLSETASSAAKKSLKDQDAEWGFEPSRSGMATEAKMGMFIVVILVCAFCFLVYHKFDMKQRALLQANMQATGETGDLSAQVAAEQQSKSFDEFYPTGEPATAPAEFARASLREPPLDDFSAPKDPSSDSVSRFGAEPTSFAATAAEN